MVPILCKKIEEFIDKLVWAKFITMEDPLVTPVAVEE